jgi:predicted nuclease of restriction endonuclease-like (RecB) superfamily
MTDSIPSSNYHQTLISLKERIYNAQYQAFKAVNKELIKLYWDIGKTIIEKQEKDGWGKSTVDQLAIDLQTEFPGIRGFSVSNIWRMRNFYVTYKDNTKLAQLVREIGWGHNIVIFEKIKDNIQREFYINVSIGEGWSRHSLEKAIQQKEYERCVKRQTNLDVVLDKPQLKKVHHIIKDDYNLDFLLLEKEHTERQLEKGLVDNIVKFLAEMGGDFCFIGKQYKVTIEEHAFFIDLLFYHRGLKSLIAIELKAEEFKFEHTGQMAGYLSLLDKQVRKPDENPSIGIIICKSKNRTIVEYALNNVKSPMGIATYNYTELPAKISQYLPSESALKKRLS